MTALFEQTTINGLNISNRMVRSATWEGMCEENGRPTQKLIGYCKDLAAGGIGLIISGYAYVLPEGKKSPGQMGIYTDDFKKDYEGLIEAVHGAGSKIVVQIVHAGGQADSNMIGCPSLAPSAVATDLFPQVPMELTKEQINNIVSAFGEAALRAKHWGFDGVQLHGAHAFLINQFLSPFTNRRRDEYGGDIEKRCRFLLEVYSCVRETVGAYYPVLIKLNVEDYTDNGLEAADGVYAAKKLSEAGIDAIEVSSGTPLSGNMGPARPAIKTPEQEAYNLNLAKQVKEEVNCPVMVVGGCRSYDLCEELIKNEDIDYIAFSRPLIREPDLPKRWLSGDHSPAKCLSCNGCFKPAAEEGEVYCVVEKVKAEHR